MRGNRLSQRTKQPYGGTGRYKPAALLSNLRDDVGIVPYAKGEVLPFNRAWPNILGVPSTPAACGRHPLQAGEGGDPSSGPGFARSTFPGGEGCLRRGVRSLTFPWGKVPPQRRMRGGTRSVLRTAPHPSGPLALPPSPRRGYGAPHPARASPCHPLPGEGIKPPPGGGGQAYSSSVTDMAETTGFPCRSKRTVSPPA